METEPQPDIIVVAGQPLLSTRVLQLDLRITQEQVAELLQWLHLPSKQIGSKWYIALHALARALLKRLDPLTPPHLAETIAKEFQLIRRARLQDLLRDPLAWITQQQVEPYKRPRLVVSPLQMNRQGRRSLTTTPRRAGGARLRKRASQRAI